MVNLYDRYIVFITTFIIFSVFKNFFNCLKYSLPGNKSNEK